MPEKKCKNKNLVSLMAEQRVVEAVAEIPALSEVSDTVSFLN